MEQRVIAAIRCKKWLDTRGKYNKDIWVTNTVISNTFTRKLEKLLQLVFFSITNWRVLTINKPNDLNIIIDTWDPFKLN